MKTSNLLILILILKISVFICEDLASGSNCQAYDGSEGVCVSIDKCKTLREKLRKGLVQKNQVQICNEKMRFVCCKISNPIITYELKHYQQCKFDLIYTTNAFYKFKMIIFLQHHHGI